MCRRLHPLWRHHRHRRHGRRGELLLRCPGLRLRMWLRIIWISCWHDTLLLIFKYWHEQSSRNKLCNWFIDSECYDNGRIIFFRFCTASSNDVNSASVSSDAEPFSSANDSCHIHIVSQVLSCTYTHAHEKPAANIQKKIDICKCTRQNLLIFLFLRHNAAFV